MTDSINKGIGYFIKRLDTLILLLFSFVLAFGSFDVFAKMNLVFYFSLLFILSATFFSTVLKSLKKYLKQLLLLFSFLFILIINSILYIGAVEDFYFINIKLLSLIILFWYLSYYFNLFPKLLWYSLLVFSLSCSICSILAMLGYGAEIINGRLLLFGENPNSTSVRMAISAIFLFYLIILNPYKYSFVRLFLIPFILSLFIVILESGSRGSVLSLLLGIFLIFGFSKIKLVYKIIVIVTIVFGLIYIFVRFIDIDQYAFFLRFTEAVENGSTGGRGVIWSDALGVFYDHPILGVGESGYVREMIKRYSYYLDTHNMFIYLLVISGVLGTFLFLLFYLGLFRKALMSYRNKEILPVTFYFFTILIAFKTGGALTYVVLWYLLAFINSFDYKS